MLKLRHIDEQFTPQKRMAYKSLRIHWAHLISVNKWTPYHVMSRHVTITSHRNHITPHHMVSYLYSAFIYRGSLAFIAMFISKNMHSKKYVTGAALSAPVELYHRTPLLTHLTCTCYVLRTCCPKAVNGGIHLKLFSFVWGSSCSRAHRVKQCHKPKNILRSLKDMWH